MLCASPRFLQSPDWPDGMPASVFGQFAQNLGRDFRATLDRFLMLQVQGSDQARGELRMLRETAFEYGEPEPGILGEGLALLENSDLRGGLPTLAMPSLWLAGRHDRQVSTRSMRTAAEQTPHSRFLEISHGGHLPFLTQADVVAQAVTTFIERAPA